jgi:hypothetical protein
VKPWRSAGSTIYPFTVWSMISNGPPGLGADGRTATRHRFERRQVEPFGSAGGKPNVARRIGLGDLLLRWEIMELTALRELPAGGHDGAERHQPDVGERLLHSRHRPDAGGDIHERRLVGQETKGGGSPSQQSNHDRAGGVLRRGDGSA